MPQEHIDGGGNKATKPLGTASFIGLRALDPFIQHSIIARGTGTALVNALGSHVFAQGPTSNTGIEFIDGLGLSPYRLALFGMATASSIKQILWKLFVAEDAMGAAQSTGVAAANTLFNTINSLLFITSATSPAYGRGEGPNWAGWPGPQLTIGAGLFGVGMLWETISEIQRAVVKSKPENQGKPYTKGLWAISRHPNYLGYTLWRTGYALAAGGWIYAAVNAVFFTWDFAARSVPKMEEYCENHYGDLWHDYAAKTKYRIFPFIY